MGCGVAIKKCDRKVYLTFDDGIHPGTQEAYDIIKEKGAKATFFLTGAHVRYAVERSGQLSFLLKLANDPDIDIGNHSYSHANQYYEGYYDKGGVKLRDGTRRSVLNDFKYCDTTLSYFLGMPEKVFAIARMPGKNAWRVAGLKDKNGKGIGDASQEADELKKAGYSVYGWDYDWDMYFSQGKFMQHSDYDPEVDREATGPEDKEGFRDEIWKKSWRFDPSLDRTKWGPADAADGVLDLLNGGPWDWMSGAPRKSGKVIVLMHERAFRRDMSYGVSSGGTVNDLSAGADKYVKQLSDFIDILKRHEVCFEKISSY